ncbi:unnamed protein product [Bemisia tabaci]|uniref:alanine transaminase n=1 Tax=Bemisia tabaci TaxID=7038 RepID=A0A9P0AB63_BEMTA|nr:unnamed protein product [Bemisia tabaci]
MSDLGNFKSGVKVMQYAVRGPLFIRAMEIQAELKQGVKKPFKEVLRANVGDAQAMGQKPITFIRQVLAAVALPHLLDDPKFPDDVKVRARDILASCPGGTMGSYTDIPGIEVIRKHVADYIHRRDGAPADWQNIILTSGASTGIDAMLKLLNARIDDKAPGVMIPTPQYPLYTSTIGEFSMIPINYYLHEEQNWSLDIQELERAITEARKYCYPRAIVVINPGNPTGQVLRRRNIEDIIKFAYKEKLFIFADEVYQQNIYGDGDEFHSVKKVITEMGEPFSQMEVASFMSTSKGYMGECGARGAYMEIINFDPEVKAMLLKSISHMHQPSFGQVAIDCVVNPPRETELSYELFMKETRGVINSLKERAKLVADAFNRMEGMSCQPVQGAMYAFPKMELPPKAIEKATYLGLCPSEFYAFQLLENTGICVIPGAGFGQKPGTYHIRTTILPQTDKLKNMLNKFEEFHRNFLAEYK